jgi:hypothetical protein
VRKAPLRELASTPSSTGKSKRLTDDGSPARSASATPGPQPKPISPFPEPLFEATDDPVSFLDALIYQMRRFGNSTNATTGEKIEQTTGSGDCTLIYQNRCSRIICLDVCKDGVAIRQRKRRPCKLYDSRAPPLSRAAAQRLAKCASTSSSDKSGRVSFNA